MTKLTEILCASRRPLRKYRAPGMVKAPVVKQMGPPRLRDKLTAKEDTPRAARHCQEQLASMLQCLKSHDFNQDHCAREIVAFDKCTEAFKARVESSKEMRDRNVIGLSVRAMSATQKNKLLQRFPQSSTTFPDGS